MTDKAKHPNQWAQLLSLFQPDDVRRMISDFEITGQCAIQCVWQGGHKSIKSATHIPIQYLAPEKVDEDGEIKAYYFSNHAVNLARGSKYLAIYLSLRKADCKNCLFCLIWDLFATNRAFLSFFFF